MKIKCLFTGMFTVATLLIAPLVFSSDCPWTKPGDPPPKPGCECEEIDLDKYGYRPFRNPPEVGQENLWEGNKHVYFSLDVQYAWNHIAGCPVYLRSYSNGLVGGRGEFGLGTPSM